MMKVHAFLFLTLSLAFMAGCKKQPITEDKFIKVYTDLVIAQDTIGQVTPQSKIKQLVFARNGITEKDYDATLKYYNENSERWEMFFDKAIAYLENQRHK